MNVLGFDIGSNSVGSAWIDHKTGKITVGISIFPAGVDESDEKRGDPKNVKRRTSRRTRVTLARRAFRKRALRLRLISEGLLPQDELQFKKLLEETDPWVLRKKGLTEALQPHDFGRVLLHLAQRRGAVGFDAAVGDEGNVKTAIVDLQLEMLNRLGTNESQEEGRQLRKTIASLNQKKKRSEIEDEELDAAQNKLQELCHSLLKDKTVTVGRLMADLREERKTPITTLDRRTKRKGPREWRRAIRNKAGKFEFHADRAMIRDEFSKLWNAQKQFASPLPTVLTDELRLALDDDSRDGDWRHKGLLFGQRMQSWDLGTLGRCVLHPSERCAPHADMYASRYLVVETINNLKIIERGMSPRSLTAAERSKIKRYLSGPLGVTTKGKQKGQAKRTVTVSDLRELMGWGHAGKTTPFRFNIETDEERNINTDWFSREIIHGAVSQEKWADMPEGAREGINRAILKHDPDDESHSSKLKSLVMQDWAGLSEIEAVSLVAAWRNRPRLDAKRLNMSRRAVRNLLTVMDRDEPWPDKERPGQTRWLTQIEARKLIAKTAKAEKNPFIDETTRESLDENDQRRYATGAKGSTARDRHYLKKHLLKKKGEPVYGPDGLPLHSPPPAPLISNPVVRKAIHEVRRHVVEHLISNSNKPDEIYIELAREAKMGKKDSDRLLFKNRLRNRIRNEIAEEFNLNSVSSTQRRAAIDRVVLAIQQGGICPLCGNQKVETFMSPGIAATGSGCELAHIVPKGCGGHNGLKNVVLAHTKCNRDMGRRTPRDFWNEELSGGFNEGIALVEKIYTDIERPKPSELKSVTGDALWLCYFDKREDRAKIDQFKKDVSDIQVMTPSQLAATTYASKQVMTYLADSLFDGNGLPERGGERKVFATDGLWTGRLRREWELFFDPHESRVKGLNNQQEHERKEKDRGDHRHHAVDAVAIALCTQQVRNAWDARELQADKDGVNTADEEAMEIYRRQHKLKVPMPFESPKQLREEVRRAVYGESNLNRPVSHRPVKRKLIGALHKETLLGPVVDMKGELTTNFTAKKSAYNLSPNHLRIPSGWDELSRNLDSPLTSESEKHSIRKSLATMEDPPPSISGIVRDRALRDSIRKCLREQGLDPDRFTTNELKKVIDAKMLKLPSGVPIHSVVLLRTMSDPVLINRKRFDFNSGRMTTDPDPSSLRAYVAGNNHHLEIRVAIKKNGSEAWSGTVVSAFETAQRKLAKSRAVRAACIPNPRNLRKLSPTEREKHKAALREIEKAYPMVDRSDNEKTRGTFVMSLSEGETLFMKHKKFDEVGYFVVAELNREKKHVVLVPHWDARKASKRKASDGKEVPDSMRDEFVATPTDLKRLAPPGHPHAVKVRVGPLGEITILERD